MFEKNYGTNDISKRKCRLHEIIEIGTIVMEVSLDSESMKGELIPSSHERDVGTHNMNSLPCADCPLQFLIERKDIRTLRSLLFDCVWNRFSLDPTDGIENFSAENEALPNWFLHAAVFTGCPVLLNYTLEKLNDMHCSQTSSSSYKRKRSLDLDADCANMVNSRIDCKFPLTDTWIHRSFKLCLSPLHLACWRLDHHSIKSLLRYGADPNIIALEESDKCNFSTLPTVTKNGSKHLGNFSDQRPTSQEDDEAKIDHQSGLCPLHFIALGIRASPKTSLFAGMKENIIHDTIQCAGSHTKVFGSDITGRVKDELADSDTEEKNATSQRIFQDSSLRENIPQSHVNTCSFMNEHIGENSIVEAKSRVIVDCVEVLLAAGAWANFCPSQKVLIGANPLDTILQPPMRIFYAPSAARGNQNPVALRRQDLVQTADHVIAACGILLQRGASVSPSFRDLYSWRPGILDCFHLNNPEQSRQLVKYCVRLGLFFTGDRATNSSSPLHLYNQVVETAYLPTDQSLPGNFHVFKPMMVRRFVADVINMEIPFHLASIVLSWCPFSVLLCAKWEITAAMKRTGGASGVVGPRTHGLNSSGLADFAEMVKGLQLASLKHKCALAIMENIRFRSQSITDLPLPPPLKRGLVNLDL